MFGFKKSLGLILVGMLFCFSLSAGDIHEAVKKRDIQKVKELLDGDSSLVKVKDRADKTPLHVAAERGFYKIARLLLEKGADKNAKTRNNTTPMHYAAANKYLEVIRLLVEAGAELDIKNVQVATPLYFASMGGHKEIVDFLIKKGATVDALDREESAPLHVAAQAGHLEVVALLIEKGAKKDRKDLNGLTPLHFAALSGKKEVVELLLNKGLNGRLPDRVGKTPLYFAAERGHKDIVELPAWKDLKEKDIKHRTASGSTYLHAACVGGLTEFAGRLIKKGADVNAKNAYGSTPLFMAEAAKHPEIVKLLTAAGGSKGDSAVSKPGGKYPGVCKPGYEPRLFAPGIVSLEGSNERDITVSPDYKEVYFSRNGKIMGMKKADGRWTAPEPASFASRYPEYEACFTPDGKQIYYISRRPLSGKGRPAAWEIWFVKREGKEWETPQMLGEPFKGAFYPTFTKDWVMYFTTGDNDLGFSRYKDGKFQEPKILGKNVNTPQAEYNSFIAADESYLIYTSRGFGKDFGQGDLYITFRKKDGSWTPAKNMGEKINTFAHEYCPAVSPDGKFFFFSSLRLGNEDIFWVDAKIIEELKPAELK